MWHRDPRGRWTFFQDVPLEQGCRRYFGAAVAAVRVVAIDIDWSAPREFSIAISDDDHRLDGAVRLTSSPTTKLMNVAGALAPDDFWRRPTFLAAMGAVAGPLLRAGKLRLSGRAPNGQRFVANPLLIWLIADSKATFDGVALGETGRSPTPGQLGDFRPPSVACSPSGGRSSTPARVGSADPTAAPPR